MLSDKLVQVMIGLAVVAALSVVGIRSWPGPDAAAWLEVQPGDTVWEEAGPPVFDLWRASYVALEKAQTGEKSATLKVAATITTRGDVRLVSIEQKHSRYPSDYHWHHGWTVACLREGRIVTGDVYFPPSIEKTGACSATARIAATDFPQTIPLPLPKEAGGPPQ